MAVIHTPPPHISIAVLDRSVRAVAVVLISCQFLGKVVAVILSPKEGL